MIGPPHRARCEDDTRASRGYQCGRVRRRHPRLEAEHVALERDDIVLVDFRWAVHWKLGPEGGQYLSGWPGLAHDAAEYLVRVGVKVVGTDCASIDPGDVTGPDLKAHYTFLPEGVLILENLANLEAIPTVSFFLALPLPIASGVGSPIRAVCLVPRSPAD